MNSPVKPPKPGQTAAADPTAILPIPTDNLLYGLRADPAGAQWEPAVEEAPDSFLIYGRKGTHEWVEITSVGGLTVTEIVPTMASVGMSAALPAKVYGTGFTATAVVHWDGAPLATSFDPLKPGELGITIDTTMAVAPSVATVTVVDAGVTSPTAVGFHFVSVTGVDYGTGLVLDATTTPPIVHLTPAGVTQPLLGGVWVPTRDATQAADVDTSGGDGKLVVLTATDVLLGGMLEPPKDGLTYERQWNETAQSWQWTLAVAAGLDFGTGLSLDATATPPIVHLQPAGDSPATLGGVYVIDRSRNVTEGLELGIDGRLRAPLATPRLAGTIVEPEDDGKGYVRTTLNGTSMWVPPADTPGYDYGLGLAVDRTPVPPDLPIVNLTPAGVAPQFLGGVYVPTRDATQAADVDTNGGDGRLVVLTATNTLLGGMLEPPLDGMPYERQWNETLQVWEWVAAPAAIQYGLGLAYDETQTPPIVHLTPAGWAPQFLGGVYTDGGRTHLEGLDLDAAGTGKLSVPLATDLLAGSIVEPPPDDKGYVRRRDLAGVSAWVPPADTPLPGFGTGLTLDETTPPGLVHLQPAGDSPATLGGVYVVDRVRNVSEGLELGLDGRLRAPLATPRLAGTIVEPEDDGKGYVRTTTDGVSMWVPPAGQPATDFGTGLQLDETATPWIVHLQMATDFSLGGIFEPIQDGMAYSRQFDALTQAWKWVPALTAGLQITSIIPDKAIYGPTEPVLDVHAYGSEFTNTTVILVDDVPAATTFVSATELIFQMNPAVPISDQFHIIKVRDPVAVPPALVDGLGAEQFSFIKATTEVDYGTGLSLDTAPTPPIVHLQPAADSAAGIGGVYVVDRVRNATEGLELGIDGRLRVPLATDRLAGAIVEPENDGKGYVRTTLNGVSMWVPPADTPLPGFGTGLYLDETTPPGLVHLQPAGVAPQFLGGVYVPTRSIDQAADVDTNGGDGRLVVLTATDVLLGGMLEPVKDGTPYERQWNETAQKWEWVKPTATATDYGTGLVYDETATPPIVNLQPAGDAANRLGGVWATPRSATQGLELDTVNMTGELKVPLATNLLAGSIVEPPPDQKGYVRASQADGSWQWVPPASGSACTISDTPPLNPQHEDLWWESDSGKMFIYYDDGTSAQWVEAVQVPEAGGTYHFAIGLTHDDATGDVNLLPAGDTPATLGGIYVVDRVRTATSGLELDIDGQLRAPLATEIYAGTIVDPPPDGLPYVRKRDTAGVSTWVPPTGGVIISDTPPPNPTQGSGWWESDSGDLFIWYDDGTSAQWVQVNGVSPPPGVHVADDPPMSPTPNALWWDSNAGTLNIWYTDVDTSQWVQIAAPQIPGVPEAPIDGVPYSRRDANWVATTSLAATPGDVKDGFQVNDHGGWIKLDGRLVNTLTSTQQAQAALLGFTTNLPNAASAVGLMNGTAMGLVAGAMTKTIAVANLPAHNMTSGGHDAGAVTTSSYDPGAVTTSNALNETAGDGPNKGNVASGGTGDDYWLANGTHSLNHSHTVDMPAHTHTVDMPNHTHTVALGGSGTPLDVTPKSMSINKFVFLGV